MKNDYIEKLKRRNEFLEETCEAINDELKESQYINQKLKHKLRLAVNDLAKVKVELYAIEKRQVANAVFGQHTKNKQSKNNY